MRILVTGNLGYIGPVLGKEIKKYIANSYLSGLDSGIFATCLNGLHKRLGDTYYDKQYFLDITLILNKRRAPPPHYRINFISKKYKSMQKYNQNPMTHYIC